MPNDITQESYLERTNAAIDYIIQNLAGDLRLEKVAEIACFSPFHFHRVFRALMGETLNQFVKRQRLERALYLMSHARTYSLTDISLECGFGSSSEFSRSFKNRYGSSPSAFDVDQFRASNRKDFEAVAGDFNSGKSLLKLPAGENPDGFVVTLRQLPARTVAYMRVFNPYQANSNGVLEATHRLMDWAEQRGLADGAWLGYMWEDPEIVAPEDCRYDVAVVLNKEQRSFRSEKGVGIFEFPPMLVADLPIAGDIQLEMRAIDWLFGTWLPRSGYVPDDQPAFEAWHGKPFAHGYEHFELSCQLPIKKLLG